MCCPGLNSDRLGGFRSEASMKSIRQDSIGYAQVEPPQANFHESKNTLDGTKLSPSSILLSRCCMSGHGDKRVRTNGSEKETLILQQLNEPLA